MEHRSSTRARHLTLFCAVPFISFHVRCLLSNSAILVHVRRQVCWDLPLFRFPFGFHSSALLTTCLSGLLNVWPIQPQALCLISCSIGHCPVCLQSSLLLIFLGHQIRTTRAGKKNKTDSHWKGKNKTDSQRKGKNKTDSQRKAQSKTDSQRKAKNKTDSQREGKLYHEQNRFPKESSKQNRFPKES